MNLNCHYIYKVILIFVLILLGYSAQAQEPFQEQLPDSIQQPIPEQFADSLQYLQPDPLPEDTITYDSIIEEAVSADTLTKQAVRPFTKGRIGFYVDYLNLLSRLLNDNIKYEGGLSVRVYRNFVIAAEGGSSILKPKSALVNGSYTSEGIFWKTGLDYIINENKESDTRIYLGVRYAKVGFSDKGEYAIASTLWPSYTSGFGRDNLEADWYEIIVGTEGRLLGSIYHGWNLRYRTILESPEQVPPVYNIPGFGPGNSKTAIGFNFYIKYLIKW